MPDPASRSSGLYGLFRLDGAPIAHGDAMALAMNLPDAATAWLAEGHDPHAPTAIHKHADKAGTTLLVGEITDIADMAVRLGLARETPTARIALGALQRFGSDTPAELLGEWSLLHRDANGRLTLMMSAAQRDRIHYAVAGSRIAVSSDLFRLARIAWIGAEVDEAGLIFACGQSHVRDHQDDRTMLAKVRRLLPGSSIIIEANGRISRFASNALAPQNAWKGQFVDAMAESENLLSRVMRERMICTARPALLLSGGLDSSLLASVAANERYEGQTLLAFSSAAPPTSGLSDETPFARQVAEQLGLACLPVSPADDADIFRPPLKVLSGAGGLFLSNRHCLTEAFQIAAKQHGATLLVNGTYGEMTMTARLHAHSLPGRLRAQAARLYHGVRRRQDANANTSAFHIRLAAHRLANLPEPISSATRKGNATIQAEGLGDGLLGYLPGATKSLSHPNEFYPGALRMDFPFRDVRLYRLFASFPVAMLLEGGADRPVARAMLHGRLPDTIRLRRRGMPAEPDRFQRMQRQAAAARDRIVEFRKAGVDDWIDLDWLEPALLRVARQGVADNDDSNEVQLTAIAAEFFCWWQSAN